MILVGDQIALFRLLVLQKALKLEILGMKRKGRSAYSIVKEEFGLRGNRVAVLAGLDRIIKEKENA